MAPHPDLWTFALHLYAQPNIPEACLTLQDHHQADVNILLFALWAATHARPLTPQTIQQLETTTRPWREQIIHPLRAARRALKPHNLPTLYAQVKAAELEAEHQQHRLMQPLLPPAAPNPAPNLPHHNLATYAKAAGLTFPTAEIATLIAATRTAPASLE